MTRERYSDLAAALGAIELCSVAVSANNAAAPQMLPSYVVAPSGEVVLAAEPRLERAPSCELDLSQVQPAWS